MTEANNTENPGHKFVGGVLSKNRNKKKPQGQPASTIIPMEESGKTDEQLINELSQKNRNLRRALNKLIELCNVSNQEQVSEIWNQRIGFAKEALRDN